MITTPLEALKQLVAADLKYSAALSSSGMADPKLLTDQAANKLSDAALKRREALSTARAIIRRAEEAAG